MKTKTLLISLAVFAPALLFGQGVMVPPQSAFKVVNGVTTPIAGATITVCAALTGGFPCSPPLVSAIFKDAALTQPLSNPFTADSAGNYQFAIAPGNYTVTQTALGFTGYSYQITASPSSTTAGLADPGANGVLFRNGPNTTRIAGSTDIISLFSGTCNVLAYLRGDGSCAPYGSFGTGAPASQITLPTVGVFSAEEGTSGSPATGMNVNTPGEYFSRWDASTNAACAAGLLDACLAPVFRIDYTNGGSGTINTGAGLLINMWGFQGVTPSGQNGGAEIGIGVSAFDKAGEPGNTNIRGANFNVGVQGIAGQVDRSGFTRSVIANEDDINNLAGADCVFIATTGSGNYCGGHSIVTVGANNSTFGLVIGTSSGTSGVGYLDGIRISGVKNNGITVLQANSMNPLMNYRAAAGGTYGIFLGGQTEQQAKNSTETYTNPTVAVLADSTAGANANSLPIIYRAFAGDTSHINEWKSWATNANTAWRMSFGSNCTTFPCPSYTDVFLISNVGSTLQAGDSCFDNQGALGSGTGNQCLHSAVSPTAARVITTPDGNSSVPMVAALVTTAAASDNVAIQGMTSSGHCTLFPTNASAATNIATTFVSAKAANQITVSHTATASMNYDISCTAN